MKIPYTAKYLTPQHDAKDYGFRAYQKYEIKQDDELGRYITVKHSFLSFDNYSLDDGTIREEILNDFIIS